MDIEDKGKHIESTQKKLTAFCFKSCFNEKKFFVDDNCAAICYEKYIFAANFVFQEIKQQGRECSSDFVSKAVGLKDQDKLLDEMFPVGGRPKGAAEGEAPTRIKAFESYMYRDPAKSGR